MLEKISKIGEMISKIVYGVEDVSVTVDVQLFHIVMVVCTISHFFLLEILTFFRGLKF